MYAGVGARTIPRRRLASMTFPAPDMRWRRKTPNLESRKALILVLVLQGFNSPSISTSPANKQRIIWRDWQSHAFWRGRHTDDKAGDEYEPYKYPACRRHFGAARGVGRRRSCCSGQVLLTGTGRPRVLRVQGIPGWADDLR